MKVEQIYTGCLAQGAAFLANPQRGKKKIKLKAPAVARAYEIDDNALEENYSSTPKVKHCANVLLSQE
ncbi:MAG: hypothetical protein ACKOKB_03460 [Bacteroidota bacterium]